MRLQELKNKRRARRIIRVRKKVSGTAECPRLAVSRSHQNINAQLIDDVAGKTLCAVSTMQKEIKALGYGGNVKAAAAVGKSIAEKAKGLGIATVAFDRRGQRYHGRIKALADAAREAGLKL
ncbi:50S ribosomal protein L18 [Phycisphaerae bacterium RAS1]|nr:50S ribosomal protein L18 [Phycisphaerae bacterium RAS1]